MTDDTFRVLIERGDLAGIRTALGSKPGLANDSIHWHHNQNNESDPLHFVSDCVGQGWLKNGNEGVISELLLAHGAAINGTRGRESPLIAAASLGVEKVSKVLLLAGADMEATSIFGARALHWAAWMGTPTTVELLISRGADIEARCQEFGATPLFWAVHGYGPEGPKEKKGQIKAAQILIKAGANVNTANRHAQTAVQLSKLCSRGNMYEVLRKTV